MRWKTTASIVKGVRVSPGGLVEEWQKNHSKLCTVIETKNPAFIMSAKEEKAYLDAIKAYETEQKRKLSNANSSGNIQQGGDK